MISILGCSGVGKSTIIKNISDLASSFHVLNEDVHDILIPMNQKEFKSPYEKFIATQEAFISRDIAELEKGNKGLIFDNRLAEYVFYLFHHPDFLERRGDIASRLEVKIERILNDPSVKAFYISDELNNIEKKIKRDSSRSRNFWPYFVENFYPHHERWHVENGAKVIKIEGKKPEEISEEVLSAL